MTYRIEFEVNVTNGEALIAYATRRVKDAWSDDLEGMVAGGESLEERALLEALLFSNENPSPDEYGIEFNGVVSIQRKE